MRKIAIILILVFVNLYSFAQTTITSDISINQDWISNNPAPWIISGNNVTVTFESNFNLSNAEIKIMKFNRLKH